MDGVRSQVRGHVTTMTGFVESLLTACPSLTELRLKKLGLKTLSEDCLRHVPALTRLDLTDNGFYSIPPGLQHLAELEQLLVRHNPIQFRGQDITVIAAMPKLKRIEIGVPQGVLDKYQAAWKLQHDETVQCLTMALPDLDLDYKYIGVSEAEDSEAED